MTPPLKMRYTNHTGKVAIRTIEPTEVLFGATVWHPEPQWLLYAYDVDKKADRTFALADCDFTALCWVWIKEGLLDVRATVDTGTYTISVDSPRQGGTHYLWIPGQETGDDPWNEYQSMVAAKAAAETHTKGK